MIYVHRDWAVIPDKVNEKLKAAAAALEKITDEKKRKAFIKKNAPAWAAARKYLVAMSSAKCWYSESKESVSRYQIDHFRPHGRAKQAPKAYTNGYSWLAFELDNFRIAGSLCNTTNQEYSDTTVGKGDWFPLADPTRRASLAARDCGKETPVLLDPADPDDPYKLLFQDDGNVCADPQLSKELQAQVEQSIDCLGLRQSQLNTARRRTWLRCLRVIGKYNLIAKKGKGDRTPEESQILLELREELIGMSKSSSEFAAAARCCLRAKGLPQFIVTDELLPLAINA